MATEGVGNIAGAPLVAFEAIKPFRTHSFLTVNPFKPWVTHTRSIHMVTLRTVLAVTSLCALKAKRPNWTLFLTPVSNIARCTDAFSCHGITVSSVVAWTDLAAINSECPRRTWLCTHQPRPSSRAGALPSDVVADPSILARAAQLTLSSVAPGGTALFTEHPRVSRSAVTFSRLVVAGRPVVTLALELAALAVAPGLTELLAAPALVPVCADTGACDGVAEGFVLALAPVAAVRSPVIAIATTRAISTSPSWFTMTSVRRNTSSMHALLCAEWYTVVSTFIISGTALGSPPIHGS